MSYSGKTNKQNLLDEKNHVEEPFLHQLSNLKWNEIVRNEEEGIYRSSFKEVILDKVLYKKLKGLNDWLEDDQIDKCIRDITTNFESSLINANEQVFKLLREGTRVQGNRVTGDSNYQPVKYIDFENPEKNSFIAISQFHLFIPAKDVYKYPDIVLFVNGFPVVLVECKSDKLVDPMGEAIEQINMYSNQAEFEGSGVGNPKLFYYNQFVVATCQRKAKFGTITTLTEKYFFSWTNPYPYQLDDIKDTISQKGTPSEQERLIYGMLSKENLLSLIQSFTVFTTIKKKDEVHKVKIVARYQQYRAVKKVINRLLYEKEPVDRGGIIWHTQGSGKSLTMMFLVREMWKYEKLQSFKVVFVTDRTDLEKQLTGTSQSIGFTVKLAKGIADLRSKLENDSSDLVMAMIQKFQPTDIERLKADMDDSRDVKEESIFPELNDSPNILVMIDEAHRSQYKVLGSSLDKALPNSTRLAFTGTPIEKTENTFGEIIDQYTMSDAISDGVTLEIVYEGRTQTAELFDKEKADAEFLDVFAEDLATDSLLKQLGYATKQAYLESEPVIKAKAIDMVEHFSKHIFKNGFKAQVVAISRLACTRYKKAIDAAIKEKTEELSKYNPHNIDINLFKKLKTAVVISGKHKDDDTISQYTSKEEHEKITDDFKLDFGSPNNTGNTGIIIVNNMLLTGFDAPIEQVLYLDRIITDHNLLQAIARVNRIRDDKHCGFVVDYAGLGHHLKEALDKYKDKEIEEITNAFKDYTVDLDNLKQAHKELLDLLKSFEIDDLNDINAFYELFFDEEIRFRYIEAFRNFVKYLDRVYPKKEALEYLPDYKQLSLINQKAKDHTRDTHFKRAKVTNKLRDIADKYLESQGVTQKVAPISIMDADFEKEHKKIPSKKTKAKDIVHAIRHEIDINIDEDPELYALYSELLESIMQMFKDRWDLIYEKLQELRERMKNDREKEPTYGLNREKEMPFFRMFKKTILGEKELSEDEISILVNNTQLLTDIIRTEIKTSDFWENTIKQNALKGKIKEFLLSRDFREDGDGKNILDQMTIFQNHKKLITDFMQLAYNLRRKL